MSETDMSEFEADFRTFRVSEAEAEQNAELREFYLRERLERRAIGEPVWIQRYWGDQADQQTDFFAGQQQRGMVVGGPDGFKGWFFDENGYDFVAHVGWLPKDYAKKAVELAFRAMRSDQE